VDKDGRPGTRPEKTPLKRGASSGEGVETFGADDHVRGVRTCAAVRLAKRPDYGSARGYAQAWRLAIARRLRSGQDVAVNAVSPSRRSRGLQIGGMWASPASGRITASGRAAGVKFTRPKAITRPGGGRY